MLYNTTKPIDDFSYAGAAFINAKSPVLQRCKARLLPHVLFSRSTLFSLIYFYDSIEAAQMPRYSLVKCSSHKKMFPDDLRIIRRAPAERKVSQRLYTRFCMINGFGRDWAISGCARTLMPGVKHAAALDEWRMPRHSAEDDTSRTAAVSMICECDRTSPAMPFAHVHAHRTLSGANFGADGASTAGEAASRYLRRAHIRRRGQKVSFFGSHIDPDATPPCFCRPDNFNTYCFIFC